MTNKNDWEKRFDEKFPSRNDCSNHENKHYETCQGCIRIKVEDEDELKDFICKEKARTAREVLKRVRDEVKPTVFAEYLDEFNEVCVDIEADYKLEENNENRR